MIPLTRNHETDDFPAVYRPALVAGDEEWKRNWMEENTSKLIAKREGRWRRVGGRFSTVPEGKIDEARGKASPGSVGVYDPSSTPIASLPGYRSYRRLKLFIIMEEVSTPSVSYRNGRPATPWPVRNPFDPAHTPTVDQAPLDLPLGWPTG